jgi:uncharacterized protein
MATLRPPHALPFVRPSRQIGIDLPHLGQGGSQGFTTESRLPIARRHDISKMQGLPSCASRLTPCAKIDKTSGMLRNRSPRGLFVIGASFAVLTLLSSSAHAATACVWRVTNAPAPFYLVGTIHALSGKDYPLPKAYDEAMHNSRQFYFEIDPDRRSADDFSQRFESAAAYPQGDDIRRHIHPETWNFLRKRFRESNLLGKGWWFGEQYVPGLQNIRPWAIAYYIWGIRGYSNIASEFGVDNHIAYEAHRQHKACAGLETNEEHVEVLSGMPDINSELILLDALVRGDKRRDDFNAMRDGWKRGDLVPVVANEKRERDINLLGETRLLDRRNLRWIPKIEAAMKTGIATSIVVGTGHYCGPNNVIELLQKRGYKIEQL